MQNKMEELQKREAELITLLKRSNQVCENMKNSLGIRVLAMKNSNNIMEQLEKIAEQMDMEKASQI